MTKHTATHLVVRNTPDVTAPDGLNLLSALAFKAGAYAASRPIGHAPNPTHH
ncbi:hypothetical protein H4S14_003390 [Agrobacterium vitis]|nr:hypothetical protein [Agrobacterium vitis]MBE1439625.1 hypothetical protein [Agrobacterium vitis]